MFFCNRKFRYIPKFYFSDMCHSFFHKLILHLISPRVSPRISALIIVYPANTLIPSLCFTVRIRYYWTRGGGDREAKPPPCHAQKRVFIHFVGVVVRRNESYFFLILSTQICSASSMLNELEVCF